MSKQVIHVLIAGSRDATPEMLDYARRAVRRAKERGYTVMVGDNPKGVDMAVVRECRRLHVPVIVAGANNFPRSRFHAIPTAHQMVICSIVTQFVIAGWWTIPKLGC